MLPSVSSEIIYDGQSFDEKYFFMASLISIIGEMTIQWIDIRWWIAFGKLLFYDFPV